MKKINIFLIISIISLIGIANVKAQVIPGAQKGGDGAPLLTPSLTWEQFRQSCLHPEQFHNQIPPTNIHVQCTDIVREYVSTAPGVVPLPAARMVISAIYSNKYHVDAEQREIPLVNRVGSCLRFKEVERVISVERVLSCGDILGMKTDLPDFCAYTTEIAKGTNPKLIEDRDTGKFIDTCGGLGVNAPVTPGIPGIIPGPVIR